jgi:hypothetical protein
MIAMTSQTPLAQETPSVLIYNYPKSRRAEESTLIGRILAGLDHNKVGGAVPSGYEHVERRLMRLVAVSDAMKEVALDYLIEWRLYVLARTGQVLPAPWVFANEENEVEYEWEHNGRKYQITLHNNGTMEYMKATKSDEQEGVSPVDRVTDDLIWLIGKK